MYINQTCLWTNIWYDRFYLASRCQFNFEAQCSTCINLQTGRIQKNISSEGKGEVGDKLYLNPLLKA